MRAILTRLGRLERAVVPQEREHLIVQAVFLMERSKQHFQLNSD